MHGAMSNIKPWQTLLAMYLWGAAIIGPTNLALQAFRARSFGWSQAYPGTLCASVYHVSHCNGKSVAELLRSKWFSNGTQPIAKESCRHHINLSEQQHEPTSSWLLISIDDGREILKRHLPMLTQVEPAVPLPKRITE